MGIEIDTEVPV